MTRLERLPLAVIQAGRYMQENEDELSELPPVIRDTLVGASGRGALDASLS